MSAPPSPTPMPLPTPSPPPVYCNSPTFGQEDAEIMAVTMNLMVSPSIVNRYKTSPDEALDFVTYRAKIEETIATIMASTTDAPIQHIPYEIRDTLYDFIRQCNRHFRQMERMEVAVAAAEAEDLLVPGALLPIFFPKRG